MKKNEKKIGRKRLLSWFKVMAQRSGRRALSVVTMCLETCLLWSRRVCKSMKIIPNVFATFGNNRAIVKHHFMTLN